MSEQEERRYINIYEDGKIRAISPDAIVFVKNKDGSGVRVFLDRTGEICIQRDYGSRVTITSGFTLMSRNRAPLRIRLEESDAIEVQ